MTIGLIGFWFLEVSSLLFIYMLFSFFLSGHMFPLGSCFRSRGVGLSIMLPLKYLAYFPAAVFLGKVPRAELVQGLWIEAGVDRLFRRCWHASCTVAVVRRYSGFGG